MKKEGNSKTSAFRSGGDRGHVAVISVVGPTTTAFGYGYVGWRSAPVLSQTHTHILSLSLH
ncbi:uncharacterized protein G2W53_003253 [Senna tora]|uniref:Uncharacterized protein n=1 Tax=Senna tora TaxID=362788 RepID=A0A834X9Y5_9FABA|nr:uncharacterized protein G2W53_003253 [Senna tora]